MGFLDKFVHAMNINDDDDDYDYDDDEYYDDEDEEEEEEPVKPRKSFFGGRKDKAKEEEKEEPSRSSKGSNKITPIRNTKRRTDSNGREVITFKPSTYEESTDIMDALLGDRTVILNLEGSDQEKAQRIIDTLSGACYMVDGNMQRISNFIFVVAPKNVTLSAGDTRDDDERDSTGFRKAVGRY